VSHERAVGSSNLHDLPHMFGALRALSRVRPSEAVVHMLVTCTSKPRAQYETTVFNLLKCSYCIGLSQKYGAACMQLECLHTCGPVLFRTLECNQTATKRRGGFRHFAGRGWHGFVHNDFKTAGPLICVELCP
jgi:hypothetical protein